MDFNYADYFGSKPSTGYERLLYDCMIGDATLFQRADMVEAGWAVVEPILEVWKAMPSRTSPTMRPERGDPTPPTNCCSAKGEPGKSATTDTASRKGQQRHPQMRLGAPPSDALPHLLKENTRSA